ncbi:hypothetical protein Y032_0352g3248 [Ancylostoma ceylanicum]|uniref:Uncharacterized protein n=1 Tax=Ancylostoma ceylanicum TaxID=53326 RepID=A0A016RXI7_9BILA|nr:hypothetical protein Y032_0352g3248 [Ancylostoma ceylanicum]
MLFIHATVNRRFCSFVSVDISPQRHLQTRRPPELGSRACSARFVGKQQIGYINLHNSQFKALTGKYRLKRHRRVGMHFLIDKIHPHMPLSIRPQLEEQTWTTMSYSLPLPNLALSN